MKLAIITSRYPSQNNPYNHMFVHARSLYFIKQKDIKLTVYVPSKKEEIYWFENVKVVKLPSQKIAKKIIDEDLVYLHLLNIYPDKTLSGWAIYKSIIENNIPTAMYLHGSEVQKYNSRKFDFDYSIAEFGKFFYKNFYFIPKMKKFIKEINKRKNCIFIAPSVWMLREAEKNLSLKLTNFKIIPNGIDTNLFKFHDLYKNRYKLITLRPLESPKYAVDVAIKIMKYLPKNFTLDIYGKGKLQKKYLKLIERYHLQDRVKIINKFVDRKNLNKLFINYGIALMPTRMDAQGVSMCEMMASGLLTVSSYSTAIPEFITDMENGILGDNKNPKEFADKIIQVVKNKMLYKTICKKGRVSMENIDINKTMTRELKAIESILKLHEGK